MIGTTELGVGFLVYGGKERGRSKASSVSECNWVIGQTRNYTEGISSWLRGWAHFDGHDVHAASGWCPVVILSLASVCKDIIFFFNSNLMIFIRRRARVMGSLVEINRSSFQLRTILLDVISSPTSHVTYKRYLPSSHKMCFSLAFFQSTVDIQDPIRLWSWSCKDMSLEMTSSHWPHLERSRSTLRESLTDKQKKKRG